MIRELKGKSKKEIGFILVFSLIIVALLFLTFLNFYSTKIKSYIHQDLVRESSNYLVENLQDINDYKGRDTIFSIDINKLNNDEELEIVAYYKIDDDNNIYKTYKSIDKELIKVKYDNETGLPIKFSLPIDAGTKFDYKIGIIENNNKLISYFEGTHNASNESIEDKLINEYKGYIIETKKEIERNKELYGENLIENEIDLEKYEEVLAADPDNISTWPQFILDKVYNNEF